MQRLDILSRRFHSHYQWGTGQADDGPQHAAGTPSVGWPRLGAGLVISREN